MEASELTKALSAVQGALPVIDKSKTADVQTKNGGSYSYKYADLSAICEKLYPLLAENGLAWTTQPTINDAGRFVLLYSLRHVSGESIDGVYPLPSPDGRPQDTGSAITYARRYTLCSVVGVVPDEDDDGQGAEQAYQRTTQQPPQQQSAPREAPQQEQVQVQVQVVSVAEEINQKDEAGAPRFSPQEKKALAAEWKKRFEFTTQQVPVHMVEKARTLISSFEGTDSSATSDSPPEPNPQERSDEGAGAEEQPATDEIDLSRYEHPLTAEQALEKLIDVFDPYVDAVVENGKRITKLQVKRREAKGIWDESGYATMPEIGAVEWGILMSFARDRIREIKAAS